jgi:hypothetical protein
MPLGANKAAIFGVAGVSTGDVVLLASTTATDDAAISFTSGITSTYGEYIFRFYKIHPETDNTHFQFQASTDGGSNYNSSVVTTLFQSYHSEDDASAVLQYVASQDHVGTSFFSIQFSIGADADQITAGELHLFNPASTVYAKQFYSRTIGNASESAAYDHFVGGYFNTTSAIDAVSFKAASGNINGTIKMWGVK